MNKFLRAYRRLHIRQDELNSEMEMLLHNAGWKRSSSYPGALWLWRKEFPESTVQWVWKGTEKIPHPGFSINGASTENALLIEAAWNDVWI